jgi:hypothetical protein
MHIRPFKFNPLILLYGIHPTLGCLIAITKKTNQMEYQDPLRSEIKGIFIKISLNIKDRLLFGWFSTGEALVSEQVLMSSRKVQKAKSLVVLADAHGLICTNHSLDLLYWIFTRRQGISSGVWTLLFTSLFFFLLILFNS